MASDPKTPPRSDELEVSLFGPGYGEAIAVHIGGGKWLLIDSCTASGPVTPLHLQYLNAIGVDAATSVILIVISHWHDDHVRGIASVVRACPSAKVALSNALREVEFLTLASLYDKRPLPEGSGVDELVAVLGYLSEAKREAASSRSPMFATVDRSLLREDLALPNRTIQASVFALSPSDAATLRSKLAFATLIPVPGAERSRIASITPNQSCVAILVEIGHDILLFGSDLEATRDADMGWSAVLTSVTVVNRVASVYKLPHHGGFSAHDNRVWTSLLVKDPYALLTAFQRGAAPLPSDADISRIVGLTPKAFATGLPSRRRWRPHERVVGEMVGDATRSVVEIVAATGHIRLRKLMTERDLDWTVELFGGARPLPS